MRSTARAAEADTTALLVAWSAGDGDAGERLFELLYRELRALAGRRLRNERHGHTLQPTALVHEAYLRLLDARCLSWRSRAHFFAVAGKVMRRVLVEHARGRDRQKRGGGRPLLSLDHLEDLAAAGEPEILALDDALSELARLDLEKARVVELRFFGGLSVEETAEVLGCSTATVGRHWRLARAWLFATMTPASARGSSQG